MRLPPSVHHRSGFHFRWRFVRLLLLFTIIHHGVMGWSLRSKHVTDTLKSSSSSTTYNYFAIGSNMLASTMLSLRNLKPIRASAGILVDYELAWVTTKSSPWASSSSVSSSTFTEAASVRPSQNRSSCVHGVLYELTESDFVTLGRSEGVPWTYLWERCHVIPYVGDGNQAGNRKRLQLGNDPAVPSSFSNSAEGSVPSFVLTAGLLTTHIDETANLPLPSRSYVEILQRGANEWNLDRDYQDYLANLPTGVEGNSGTILFFAERFNPRPNYLLPRDGNM